MDYNPQQIERKWRRIWEKKKTFQIDLKRAKRPYYNLMMFPYPSAEGLHVGNVYAFTGSDIHGRFQKMKGFDVFEPIGFDAFGIHSENFAIQKRIHPKILIEKNIKHFREQLKNLGCLFDWRQEVDTTKPNYYKWTQWLFLQLFKAGLAYRKKAPVGWCPSCKTVLADEQVLQGKCERCESQVIQKELEQWFFKITKYAEKLLKNLKKINWSERTKLAQINWIGKSEGTEILFEIKGIGKKIPIVTTRADTIFGATFLVLAPEHQFVKEMKNKIKNWREVESYIRITSKKSEFERGLLRGEKTGVKLEGLMAVNPANNKEIPVYISDFVLITYGTGAIMSVPAHDNRDFEFAKKFDIPIIKVIEKPKQSGQLLINIYDVDDREIAETLRKMAKPIEYITPTVRAYSLNFKKTKEVVEILKKFNIGKEKDYRSILEGNDFTLELDSKVNFLMVYTGDGKHINSGFLNGLNNEAAIEKMTKWLSRKKMGKSVVYYHLRDWLISRQRYWGPPIPIIYCQKCGSAGSPQAVPVPEKDLPVLLPYVKNFRPKETGKSPLASVKSFVKTKCPKCKGPAKRETDVSDTFLDSSWYCLRYPSVGAKNTKLKIKNLNLEIPWNQEITRRWLPVDMYIGGQEHAVLHLLYTRFITMALKDLGFLDFEDPFKKFWAHGLLTKGGAKMSKSKGNVVNPDDYYKKYGADTLRMYLMFLGPFEQGGDWQDQGVIGIKRFLDKVWSLKTKIPNSPPARAFGSGRWRAGKFQIPNKSQILNSKLEKLLHQTIKKVTEDLENLNYNTAISALMILVNEMTRQSMISNQQFKILLILLAPFAPYITEELWYRFGCKNSIHNQKWPKYDEKLIREEVITLVIQVNGRVRDKIEVEAGISEGKARELAISQKKIKNWIGSKRIKKVIFVPGKLINIVI